MEFLNDPEFWSRLLRIVLIDLALAGDNAVVIALAVRPLGAREQFWGRVFGTGGAVILRVIFIFMVTWLMRISYLQLIGGLMLIWIAVKLVRHEQPAESDVKSGKSLKEAIGIIILADVVMSLDNVIAIAGAAKGDMGLVIFGLLLSIPLVVWGSGVLAKWMNRFPLIIWLGGGVLGFVAMEMILNDKATIEWLGAAQVRHWHHFAPLVLGVGLTALGWWFARGARPAQETGGPQP